MINEYNEQDLASGSFLVNWPKWVRWLLFLPAAIIVPALFFIIQFIMQTWFLDMGPNAFYINLLRGVIYGAGFIYVGSIVAPYYQKAVALILMVIVSIYSGMAFLSAYFVESDFNTLLEVVIMLIAAGISTYNIFNESK